MGVTMEDDPVHAGAKGPIAQGLQIARMKLPALFVVGRERLRGHDAFAARVRDGRGFEATVPGLEAVRPELAHGHIRHGAEV